MKKKTRHNMLADTSCRLCLVIPKDVRDRILAIKCANESFSDAARHCLFDGLEHAEAK